MSKKGRRVRFHQALCGSQHEILDRYPFWCSTWIFPTDLSMPLEVEFESLEM